MRDDADHRAREPVELDRPADQAGVRGEAPRPEPLAQHDDGRRVGSFVVRHERAAENRPQAEQREQVRVRANTLQALGLAVARKVVGLRHEHRDPFERARAPLPFDDGGSRGLDAIGAFDLREVFPEQHEPARLRERQRLQQHGAHETEDSGVRADAERERQDRYAVNPVLPRSVRSA